MATVDWLPEMLFAAGIGTAVLVTPPLPFETACSTPPVANSNGGSEQLATAGGNVGRVLTRFRFPGEKSPTVVPAGFALSSFKTFVTVTDADPFFERFKTSVEPPARRTWISLKLEKSPFEKSFCWPLPALELPTTTFMVPLWSFQSPFSS